MRIHLRSLTCGLALVGLTVLPVLVPRVADAKDDEERKVMTLRDNDASSAEKVFAEKAEEKRLESIQFLRELLDPNRPNAPEGDQRAEMMLRLADLYFEQGRYLYLAEMDAFNKVYDDCFNADFKKPGCAEGMKADNGKSRKWQEDSIKLYQLILKNYPRYPRADEATYYLGAALQDVGRREEAVEYFNQLTKKYPQSSFVPDSYVNIGEYHFDNNDAFKALLAYKKATAYRDSDKYAFALYKLGWCYFNVGEMGPAIDTMKQVVAYSMAQESQGNASRLQLQEEALKDLVRFFADSGNLDEAYEYFNKLGKKDLIRSMLKRLAGMYFEQGKYDQTIETYKRLIAEDANSPDNPGYQSDIIDAYRKMGKRREALDEIERLRKTYGKQSAWARANASNTDALKDAQNAIAKNLRDVAIDYHNYAKKLKAGPEAEETYQLAYNAYKTYLTDFPESEHAYEMHYAFGELNYTIKRYDEAFDQYMAVVKMDPNGARSRFCAESAIFAADEMVKKEQGNVGKPAKTMEKGKHDPMPLSAWEQRLVDACAQYADLYKDDKVKNVIYRSAYLLYNKYRFEEAAEQFKKVIQMDPQSKEAEQAAHLILTSFDVNEDYANLKKNSKFYYDQEGLGSAKFKKEMYDIYEKSSFKLIEVEFAADKDAGKAADAFLAFQQEFPDSEVAAQALNNASVYYNKVKRVADEMKVRHILVDDPRYGPKTKYYYNQIGELGFNYETLANFAKAAEIYEKMFSLYPDERAKVAKEADSDEKLSKMDQQAADAIYSAAVFQKASGNWQQSITDYTRFLEKFPKDERSDDVKLTIGKIYEEQEKWTEAGNQYYAFYTKSPPDTAPEYLYFARLHHGLALEKLGEGNKAMKLYDDTKKLYEAYIAKGGAPGPHTEFVAEMMFKLAAPEFDKYAAMKITGCGCRSEKQENKAIESSLKAKAKALVGIEGLYTKIIQTGAGEWGLASLVMLGRVYENMGDTLLHSAQPFYLTDDQRDIYKMQLEDKVYPQTEKAVAAYKAALDKSYEITLYNDNTAFATRRLGELRPNDFPGLFEQIPEARFTSAKTRNSDFETEL